MTPIHIIKLGLMTLGLLGFFVLASTPVLQAAEQPGTTPLPPAEVKMERATPSTGEGQTEGGPLELTKELERPMKVQDISQDGREGKPIRWWAGPDIEEAIKEQNERSAVSF